jgi:choline dehydrogenase-like flavoprotein
MVLPHAQVVRLTTSGNRVTELELRVNDQQHFLRPPLLSPNCTVVLAASTIESTRLALDSLPAPAMGANRMGSNLMAHLRSDITARIRRSAFPASPPSRRIWRSPLCSSAAAPATDTSTTCK